MTKTPHERHCKICAHPDRDTIEEDFIAWLPQAQIVRAHKIVLSGLQRHVRATGLIAKRDSNLGASLSRFIERCHKVRPTAASFVSAVVAFSKLDARGRTVDRTEDIGTGGSLEELFLKMNRGELLHYAETGQLPERLVG